MQIKEKIQELVSNLLIENEIELVDMIYRRESGNTILRFFVDKVAGVTLDDCTKLSEEIGKILDSQDIMPSHYLLEVSSPGLDRPLKTKRDFERVIGQRIRVHTYEPICDKRDHGGEVKNIDDEYVTVDEVKIPLNKISKAKLEVKI